MSESLYIYLILTVCNLAVFICQFPLGLSVYADRSSQYTSEGFTSLPKRT